MEQLARNLSSKKRQGAILEDSEEAKPWHELFSSLYLAELAAAKLAQVAEDYFVGVQNHQWKNFYHEMVKEEKRHGDLLKTTFGYFTKPPKTALDIYEGKRMKNTDFALVVEIMAIVHLVFEPAAMAFFSFINASAHELFEEKWANRIQAALLPILKEEVQHIRYGRDALNIFLPKLTSDEYLLLQKSVAMHRAFIKTGTNYFFKRSDPRKTISTMLNQRFEFSHQQAIKGVLYATN